MKASDLINQRSETLEPLHSVARELADLDNRGKAHLIEYTKLDVIAAAMVFTHIMANKKAHQYVQALNVKDVDTVTKEMEDYGKRIRQLVLDMTAVDLGKGE